jgi:hypothetical protein
MRKAKDSKLRVASDSDIYLSDQMINFNENQYEECGIGGQPLLVRLNSLS